MTLKINTKRARRELDKIFDELRACEPKEASGRDSYVIGACHYAYKLGIIDENETLTRIIQARIIAARIEAEVAP